MGRRGRHLLYADDSTEPVGLLVRLRLPWLLAGLVLGSFITLIVSSFEGLLASNVRLAFFIPVIVYLSDAAGTQTEAIYIRSLLKRPGKFSVYLLKELALGLILGTIFGLLLGGFALVMFKDYLLATTVALAMFASLAAATIIALVIPSLLYKENADPAVGAGPFATAIQDLVTILIYFSIASWIILA